MDRVFREHYINLHCKDWSKTFQAMKYFRQLLSRPNARESAVLEQSVKGSMVPRFVELLDRYDQPNIQVEAAWALTNLACGTSMETWMLVALGAAQKLVEVITRSPNADARDQAIWAVSNIAGDSHDCREYLLKIGALEACLSELNRFRHRRHIPSSRSVESRRNLLWTLSNLCRSRSSSSYPWLKFAPVVTSIRHLFMVPANLLDSELVAEACWTLAYLMDGQTNWPPVQGVIDADLVGPLVGLLNENHNSPNRVLSAVVRAVGNIVTGTAEQTQTVLDAGGLPRLRNLLKHDTDCLVREVCWLLSNITAGTEAQIGQVLRCPDVFSDLIVMSGAHRSAQVRREAAWAVCNALSCGDVQQRHRVVRSGCISPLCKSLSTCEDSRLLEALLAALEIIIDLGREQQADTFGRNVYAGMIAEFGVADHLKRIALETQWLLATRAKCLFLQSQLRNDTSDHEESEKSDGKPIVIQFKRNRGRRSG